MRPFINALFLTILFGCHKSDLIGPERTELAFIEDSSYYADGCEPYIVLDMGTAAIPPNGGNVSTSEVGYKPSPATLPLVQRIATPTGGTTRTPVTIRFVETNNRVKIQCGWVSPTVTEIKVLSIVRR